jgi:two-component system, sensor histidine kinase and response regulator
MNTLHKILIVDDNPQNIKVLGSILSENNYGIIVASNGLQTLRTLEKVLPDLILLDVNMPEMDGFETCERIKSNPLTQEIPILFLTARVDTDDIVRGFKMGAVDYITKPFNSVELLARIQTHIDFKDQKKLLSQKNDKIQELLRVVLHDLINPLSGIKGVIEQDVSFWIEMKSHLEYAVDSCFTIIDNVRKMNSLNEGKMKLSLQHFNLRSAIDASILILSQKIKEKDITINLNVSEEFEIFGDASIFTHSIISNLLTNAIKFSNPKMPIEIYASKEREFIKLSIQDQGIGIPKGILNDIYSLTKPTSRLGTNGEKGTGYGMPLVKRFIEAFGGSIHIESKDETHPDHGTTIILYLKTKIELV